MSRLPSKDMKEIDDRFWKIIAQERSYRKLYEKTNLSNSKDKK